MDFGPSPGCAASIKSLQTYAQASNLDKSTGRMREFWDQKSVAELSMAPGEFGMSCCCREQCYEPFVIQYKNCICNSQTALWVLWS